MHVCVFVCVIADCLFGTYSATNLNNFLNAITFVVCVVHKVISSCIHTYEVC